MRSPSAVLQRHFPAALEDAELRACAKALHDSCSAELLVARLEQPLDSRLRNRAISSNCKRHRKRRDLIARPAAASVAAQPRQILFRRHQRQPVAIRLGDQRGDLAAREWMMVGKARSRATVDAAGPQRAEEALRDRRSRQRPARGCAGEAATMPGIRRQIAPRAPACPAAATAAATASAACPAADHDQRIGARELRRQRCAQRTRRKHAAVAERRGRCRSRSARHPWRRPGSGSRHPSR